MKKLKPAKQIKHSDGSKMKTREKLAHITMWTTDELEDVVKISEIQESTVRVTETMRERERKRRRMFVCDNILKTKRESKDLSLLINTRKQNKPTSNQHIEQANDEGC